MGPDKNILVPILSKDFNQSVIICAIILTQW